MTSTAIPASAAAHAEPDAVKTPKKAALASWIAQADQGVAQVVYE